MEKGFKPMPLSLKIVFILTILWIIGTFFAISMRYEQGIPFFGMWISGAFAIVIIALLDIIGPLGFLYALYNRLSWGIILASTYIGIFVLNSLIALFKYEEVLGTQAIAIPALVYIVFLGVILKNSDYFE